MTQDSNTKTKYLIYGILLLAILLRAYNINAESLWTDETISVYIGLHNIKDIFWNVDPTPPLHNILLHFWINLFGISAIAVRSLSVIFSVVAVYAIYLVGNLINKKTGVYAALLLAISPISILYAQEARSYSLLFLTSLLSMYFYIKYLKNDSKTNASVYIVSTILMVYTHIFGIFVILAQSIHYLFQKKIWKWIIIQAIIFIAYLPWLLTIPKVISSGQSSFSQIVTTSTLSNILNLIRQFSTGLVSPIFGILLIIIFVILITLFVLSKEKKSLLILWLTMPVIIPMIITVLWFPIYSIKHVCFAVIPFILIIALGLNTLPKKIKTITMIIIIILTLSCVIIQQNTRTKDDWKNINKYITEKNVSQVAIMSWYESLSLSYYYNPDCILTKHEYAVYACIQSEGIIPIQNLEDLRFITEKKILLITSRLANTPQSEQYIAILKKQYYFTENVTFYAYNKTIFINRFFNTADAQDPMFNSITVYTLVKK